MTFARTVVIAVALTLASPVTAQDYRPLWPGPGHSPSDPHRQLMDRHRYEMDRLRMQADQRDAFARQLQLEARLSALDIQISRQPIRVAPPAAEALPLESERQRRLSANTRLRMDAAKVSQIDAWLDRPR